MAQPIASAARREDERLTFQVFSPWSPRINLNADTAIVYGLDESLPKRLGSWREHGYHTAVMTGVAWGTYQDYLHGQWNRVKHEDEIQTDVNGNGLHHGAGGGDVWYMSPGKDYGDFLISRARRALAAGAEAIYLEEPEFWARAGYEASFKREWEAYYHEPWRPPHESADAEYRASKLKYFLYRRALGQVFDFVKKYGLEHGGRTIPCYVATHSLLNYAHWRIVSPESSLLDVGCDGYIAQVWTGTARTPNVYQGVRKSRTFETAFLEYGAMQNLARASGRRVWYLNDPVEDDPNHDWDDYRANWESTLIASLLQPEVCRYEVMPWPDRVFAGSYPARKGGQRVPISKAYEAEIQAVMSAMGDLKQPADAVRWEVCGTQGVGVLVSDTMMFQRGDPKPSDAALGSFYGLALPLLKHGIPVEPVQMESAASVEHFLDRYRVLLLTYEGQKPPSEKFHEALAAWVRGGGVLVVIDDDKDLYNAVHEWWNTAPLAYATPRMHLFEMLGLQQVTAWPLRVDKGIVHYVARSPATLSYDPAGAEVVRDAVRKACEPVGIWRESSALVLRRGQYVIAAGLDESIAEVTKLRGRFISLFEPELPVIKDLTLSPGTRAMLVDLDRLPKQEGMIAAACRITQGQMDRERLTFRADGVDGSQAIICLALAARPREVRVSVKAIDESHWEFAEGVLRVRFQNRAQGVNVEIVP